MKLNHRILAFFLLLSCETFPQFFNTGQDPASVKWYQIKTANFQVIYPESFYEEANRVTNLLEYMYEYVSSDYQFQPEKISVILHNQSVLSNGYVVWAPRRSEWVTTPPAISYCQDWLEQLAIHEFRHVVQVNNLEQGLTRILNLVFGEVATGSVAGYLPFWFLEGDAVLAETMYSSSGRGRVSDFDKELRAIELDRKKRFSYDQSYLGSYKFFIPDHYTYGYHMVAFSKIKYNINLWEETINHVGRNPYLAAPFFFGLRKTGKLSKNSVYTSAFDSLNILWSNNLDSSTSTNNSIVYSIPEISYTNYRFVQPMEEGVFAVRSGIDDITRFVLLNDTSESIIHTPGQYNNTRISISDAYVAWEEIVPDARWAQRNYSVIKLLDRQSGKIRILRPKTRWFSPQLSPKNDILMCLEIGLDNKYSLVFFDIDSDRVLRYVTLNQVNSAFCPVWITSNTVAFISLDRTGKCITDYSLEKDSFSTIYRSGFVNIDNLSTGDNRLFFSCDYQMARGIFSLNLVTGTVSLVIRTKHGVDYPFYNSGDHTLYYSDYTLNGYRPTSNKIDSARPVPIHEVPKYSYPWVSSLSPLGNFNVQESDIPEKRYPITPYNRLLHSFTFHSWLPFYSNITNFTDLYPEIYPGISLFSQNKLSTLTSHISYYYKDHKHYIEPHLIFEGLFPVFELHALFSNRPDYYFWPDDLPKPHGMRAYYNLTLRTYLPLRLTCNKFHRYIRPEIDFGYLNRYYYTRELGIRRGYGYLETSISASSLLKQSLRDIQPRFGQTLFILFNQSIIHTDLFTHTIAGSLSQYLPGIIRHQGIRMVVSYEQHEKNKVPILNNRILPPRGYNPDMNYYRNIRAMVEYTLPLIYPDLSIGPLAYIKRIHSTFYYDAAKIRFPERINNSIVTSEEYFTSIGFLLHAEVHFLRFFMPFQPVLRISFLPEKQVIDFGFGITINPFGN